MYFDVIYNFGLEPFLTVRRNALDDIANVQGSRVKDSWCKVILVRS
jgi:hypothetical protein